MRVWLVFLLLMAPLAVWADQITLPDGSIFCCTKRYTDCEDGCRAYCLGQKDCKPKPECASDCRQQHCQASQKDCEEPAVQATAPKRPGMALHYDGEVSGPGIVHFEIGREGGVRAALAVYGILYGKRKDNHQVEVLAKTETHVVIPGETTRFELEVTDDNFKEWSNRCENLTVAIALPSEKDRQRWTYRNLLTQDDAAHAQPGNMRVKGTFVWHGPKGD